VLFDVKYSIPLQTTRKTWMSWSPVEIYHIAEQIWWKKNTQDILVLI